MVWMRRIGFASLWLGFLAYAFLAAPPDSPETWTTIVRLSSGDWAGINPLIVALFNLMGLWPLIYAGFLYSDGRGQRVRAFPFAIASFAVGAFALLPYLALRQPNPRFTGPQDRWLRLHNSRWLGVGLSLGAIALLAYGLGQGDWADFAQQWQTSRFIHVMSLDFLLLCALVPALLGDDAARRGGLPPALLRAIALVPLLGPLAYLCLRPPLVADSPASLASDAVGARSS